MDRMDPKMCASCVWRGKGRDTLDERGVQHCYVLNKYEERQCITNDHEHWELDQELLGDKE